MARGFQGAVMRGFGARDHEATVVETERLAPHFLRIRFSCAPVFEDLQVSPTAWLRFWIPDPDGSDTEYQRAYTLSEADAEAGTFAIDVVLHEPAGPASRWAMDVAAGSTLPVTALGSTTFEVPEEQPAGYLLVGDSASIPALNGIIGAIPDEIPIELYLEQHDPDDLLISLTEHPRMRIHWVFRNGPTSLAGAIEARDWSDWHTWAAPEAGSLKHLRTRLKDEFGFPKAELHARAYWTYGRAMGKLRGKQEEAVVDSVPAAVTIEAPISTSTTLENAASGPAVSASAPPTASTGWRAQAAGRLLAPLRPTLWIAGIAQAVITLVQLAPFVLLVELARLLLSGAEPGRLWNLGILAVVFLGAGALLESALLLWLHAVDARFSRDLRQRLLGKLARLPLGWFTARGSGATKHLVQDDTLSLHYLVTHAVPDAVAAVVAPIAVLVYLFIVDWRIALVMFIPILVYIVAMWVMLVQSGTKPAEAMRWAERMDGAAAGYLEGQPVIRTFGGAAASAFRVRLDGYLRFLNEWQRPFIAKKTVMDLANRPATYLWLITLAGTALITSGSMPAVDILPFLLLGTAFGARLLGIGYGLGGIRDGMLAARRIQVALDEQELSIGDDAPPASASSPGGFVEFDDVTFGYRPGVPVVQGISLELRPGTVTALVGPSGSGKSTLAALLARFHDVGSGAIRVGGRDVRSLTSDELYSAVGFVLQDTQLVHGTVRENIALAVPDATSRQVEQAARDAQLHERIIRMPQGYDTVLGADAALSGGERQRLTIARALLADTEVLVLDEATAYADPESEFQVQQAISALTRDRTVLVIAHRLHTITAADQIVVLDDGCLVESGTHEELLSRAGRYYDLWNATESAGAVDAPLEATR